MARLPPGNFRVFGSPLALQTQQMVTYLDTMRLPYTTYTQHALVSIVAAFWHRAADSYTTLSPDRTSLVTVNDLIEYCEPRCPNSHVMPLDRRTHPWLRTSHHLLQLYAQWWLMCTGGYYRWSHPDGSAMSVAHARYFMVSGMSALAGGVAKQMRQPMRSMLTRYGVSSVTGPYITYHFEKLCRALELHFTEHRYLLGTPKPTAADCVWAACFNAQFLKDTASRKLLVESDEFPNLLRWAKEFDQTARAGLVLTDDGALVDAETAKLHEEAKLDEERRLENTRLTVDARGRRRRSSDKQAPKRSRGREADGRGSSDRDDTQERVGFLPKRGRVPKPGGGGDVDMGHFDPRGVGVLEEQTAEPTRVATPPVPDGPTLDVVPDTLEPVLELAADVMPWMASQAAALRMWESQQKAPEKELTLPGSIYGVEAGQSVKAHEVPRLLDQPWTLAFDDVAVDCDVSLYHVLLAQRVALDFAKIDLSSELRAAPEVESEVLPKAAMEHIHDVLRGCDTGLFVRPYWLLGIKTKYAVWRRPDDSTDDR